MEVTFIYELRDPFSMERRYVGKSKDPPTRYRRHLSPSDLRPDTYKTRWLRKLLARGARPIMIILCEVQPDEDANRVERDFIRWLRGASRLTNGTPGGDGGATMTGRKLVRSAPSPMRGVKWHVDDPRRQQIRARQLGVVPHHALARARVLNLRKWVITTPAGARVEVLGLKDFCALHGLSASKLAAVASGGEGRRHHKGYRCEKL